MKVSMYQVYLLVFGLNFLMFAPESGRLGPEPEVWQEVIGAPHEPKPMAIQVKPDGKMVLCNEMAVKHDHDRVETVVTVDNELYINGQKVTVPRRKKSVTLRRSSNAGYSGSSCCVQ